MPEKLYETIAFAFKVPVDTLNAETEFRTLIHWDSFAALALVYGIEDAFGVQIGYGALNEVRTIDALQALIVKRLAARQTPA